MNRSAGEVNFLFCQLRYFSAKLIRSIVIYVLICRKKLIVAGVRLSENVAYVDIAKMHCSGLLNPTLTQRERAQMLKLHMCHLMKFRATQK